MAEFEPLEGGVLDFEYREELLGERVMPAAITRISDQRTGLIYAVRHRDSGKTLGLPLFDLAGMKRQESVEHFVSHRLEHRFGLFVDTANLHFWPLESNESAVHEIGHRRGSCNRRIYYPVTGHTDEVPMPEPDERHLLVPLRGEVILGLIEDDVIDDVSQQVYDMHQEVLRL